MKTASDEAKFESVKKTIQNVKSLESVLEDIKNNEVNSKINDLKKLKFPYKKDLFKTAYQIKRELLKNDYESYKKIDSWIKKS